MYFSLLLYQKLEWKIIFCHFYFAFFLLYLVLQWVPQHSLGVLEHRPDVYPFLFGPSEISSYRKCQVSTFISSFPLYNLPIESVAEVEGDSHIYVISPLEFLPYVSEFLLDSMLNSDVYFMTHRSSLQLPWVTACWQFCPFLLFSKDAAHSLDFE